MEQDLKQWKKWQKGQEMEAAGSLTPELSGGGHSSAHPFRYMGTDPEGAPPRGQRQPKPHGNKGGR